MNLSNKRILDDVTKLSKISQMQLPVKVSYAIAKNISKIELELSIYNNEREKLIEKYSLKDDNGKTIIDENSQIKIKEEYKQAWDSDINDLLAIENTIDIHKFSINELEGFSITPAELMVIDYMIEE